MLRTPPHILVTTPESLYCVDLVSEKTDWGKELRRSRTKSLDAPSWLWSSVVDLITIHEGAYLDHCRRHVAGRG